MYNPLVSIVIPAYNASNYLADAINSALTQTYKNIEIIVVNDGSKDNGATRSVAESFGDKIRYFEKENGGSSSALNYGIRQMKGEWFSWLSHDDRYYPKKIEKEISILRDVAINDDSCCAIFSGSDFINKDGKVFRTPNIKSLCEIKKQVESPNSNRRMIASFTKFIFNGCTCLLNRTLFEKIGFFDETLRLVNDADMWFRIYASGVNVFYVPEILVSERIHSMQVSRTAGFSYHNPEQDLLWNKRLEWLKSFCPDDYDCFYKYGVNAITKTRYKEGKKAFKYAADLNPAKRRMLFFKYLTLRIKATVINLLKKLYIKIKL